MQLGWIKAWDLITAQIKQDAHVRAGQDIIYLRETAELKE